MALHRTPAVLAVSALILALFSTRIASAGPVVIGGDDLPLHGSYSGGNLQGWLYMQKALDQMYPCVTRPGNDGSIAALGVTSSTATSGNGGGAIYHAATVALGKSVTYYDGAAGITGFFSSLSSGATNPAIIWICSGLGDLTNELTGPEIAVINTNANALAAFVNSGGGLMAHTCVPGQNNWLPTVIPGLTEVSGCNSGTASLTLAGVTALPGLTNADIRSGPCHSTFLGPVGSLSVLAYDSDGKQFIIGGGCGTQLGGFPCDDSMLVHYTFDDPAARGDDTSGQNHDATLGAGRPIPGSCGTAIRFFSDNNVQELSTADNPALDVIGAMTGTARIRVRGTQSTDYNAGCSEGTIFCKGGNYWFQIERNNDKIVFQNEPSGAEVATANVAIPVDTWVDVGFVRGPVVSGQQTIVLYYNGVAQPTYVNGVLNAKLNNLPFATPTHPLMIGNYGFGDDPGACEFNGDIDDVRIYAKKLSNDDMVAITKCPCHTPTQSPCDSTSALVINTGWDQSTGSEIASGQADNEWVVMSDPDAGTTEPRPAFSIPPYNVNVSWAPAAANSRWVSSYPTSVDDLNGHYVYDYDFCLQDTIGANLAMCLRADDIADVYLNGNFLGATGTLSFSPSHSCVSFNAGPAQFLSGQNKLRVDLQNTLKVAMGLDVTGTIVGHVPRYDYCCSETTASLAGMAWEDDNHNGKFDTGEPKLQHWTVTLSNGMTRKTDVLGNYYFAHLPAGSYTVSIGVPFLWSQTFPHSLSASPGVHQVLLDRGEARTNLDFGERLTVIVVGGGGDLPIKRQIRAYIRPNPVFGRATIGVELSHPMDLKVGVFDIAGRLVRDLSQPGLSAGPHDLLWDGTTRDGVRVQPGVYFVRIGSGTDAIQTRVVMMR